ncbi:MAG TPA: hypothetical protein VG820_05055 [Fimbriimonadaceae bacterium]|nr:hypothetical protein [Fimbriimonadaceae bacterium]
MGRSARFLLAKCCGLFSLPLLAFLFAFHALTGPSLSPGREEVNYHSLKALRAHIESLRAIARERGEKEGEEHAGNGPAKEDESLDYLEALEAYLAPRAYPNDSVDWDAMKRAVAKRDLMAGGPVMKTVHWEFLGPNNLNPPGQWAFGPGRISGRIASAAFDPTNPLIIYAASAGGGVWKSTNGGGSWVPLGDGWSSIPASCVVVDPNNPSIIYVGTGDWDGWGGYSQGIERSTDGGATWTAVGTSQFGAYAVRRILVDPTNGQIVTAVTGRGAGGNGMVWRSIDGGTTWTAVITTQALWSDIVCSAPDGFGNRTYYAAAGGAFAQVWKSTNQGATWTKLTTPMRSGASVYDTADLAASPTAPGTVYLLGTGDKKVWKSTNNGGSWTDISGSALTSADWDQAWYDFYLTCSTNGSTDVVYAGLIDILQSFNGSGGANWRSFMNGYTGGDLAHVDEHDLIVDPTNPSHLLACNDGGVYDVVVGGSGGGTFASLNAGLGVTEFYYGDVHPTDGGRMIGGAQDNGSPASFGNIASWVSVTGGDGGAALINQTNPAIQYTTYQYFGGAPNGGTIGLNRTLNNWASFNWTTVNVGSDRVGWMGPVVMGATDSNTLYVGTNYLWKYNEATVSWSTRLGNQALSSNSTVASIGVTKADPNIIYTGSGDAQLWVTRNGGSNWSQINTGAIPLPNRAYTAISVRDDNGNDVLVGVSGNGTSHLWRCFDTTSGARTWIDVSGIGTTALPDIPINAIERDPSDPINIWYVGTDIGVFKTTDAGSTWLNVTQPLGLPNVQITALHVRSGYLYAVTYGRGMWRLGLNGTGGNVTLVSLTVNPTAVVGPAPSTGTVTISGPAPAGGAVVALASSNPTVASVPSSVTVPEGLTTATFAVSTTAVTTQTHATISGSLNGSVANADLTVNPNGLTNLTLNPASVVGGNTSIGTVTIATPAPPGGSVVQLSSSNTAAARAPATVTIAAGQTSASFNITTSPLTSDATSTIGAVLGASSAQADLTVLAPTIQSITIGSGTVVGGNTIQGAVTLTGKAPSGGAVIALQSSNTAVATTPSSVTIPANQTTVNFTVTTHIVSNDTNVTITGTYRSLQATANLLVTAQKVIGLTMTPNPAVGGNTVQGRVTLAGPATSGTVVQLSSDDTAVASVPASVTVSSGQTSATFNVTTHTVNSTTIVNIFAVLGSSSQQCPLTVQALALYGFTLSTNTSFERSTLTGTVSLNGPALSGGAVVQLSQTNGDAATIPSSVTIPQGQSSKTFTITTKAVTSTQFTTITATRGRVSLQQNLTVTAIPIQNVQLNASMVTGGTSVSGVVHLAARAPSGGYVVNLTSSYPTVAKVPARVTVASGASSVAFTVTTYPVPQTYFVTITGTHGLSTASAPLQVVPPEVSTFKLSTYRTKGGNSLTGTVTLTGKAPTGGLTVHISANPNLAAPATTVVVKAGSTSVSFKINTQHVSTQTPVTMTAYTFNVVKSVLLTLTP